MNSSKKNKWERLLQIAAAIAGAIGIIILVVFVYRLVVDGYNLFGPLDLETSSKTGDFVGGVVGSFWALTSVLLLIITLGLQRKSVTEAREAFRKQQLENNFYNLIRTHQEIASTIVVEIQTGDQKKTLRGREFFTMAREDLITIYKYLTTDEFTSSFDYFRLVNIDVQELKMRYGITDKDFQDKKEMARNDQRAAILKSYQVFFNKYGSVIGHYFRNLYHIVRYLREAEKSSMGAAGKYMFTEYAGFIQAQMSSSELFLLFYNCVCFPKMKELVVHYDLLENLPREDLIEESHEALYGKTLKSRDEVFTLEMDPIKQQSTE